jgi:hypothetical protein
MESDKLKVDKKFSIKFPNKKLDKEEKHKTIEPPKKRVPLCSHIVKKPSTKSKSTPRKMVIEEFK